MRFEVEFPNGSLNSIRLDADGIPPNERFPSWFRTDDGWVYPASSVIAFKMKEEPGE